MAAIQTKTEVHDSKRISPEPSTSSDSPEFNHAHGDLVAIARLDFTRINPHDRAPPIDPSKVMPVTVEHQYMFIASKAEKGGAFRPDVVSRPQIISLRNPDKTRLVLRCRRQHRLVAARMGLPVDNFVHTVHFVLDPAGDCLDFSSCWWEGVIRTALMVGVKRAGGGRAKIVVQSWVVKSDR